MIDYDNRINRIEIDENMIRIFLEKSHGDFFYCPISLFLGDRLYDWEKYLDDHPDIADKGIKEMVDNEYEFTNHFNTCDFIWAFTKLTEFLQETDYLNCHNSLQRLESYRMKNDISLNCTLDGNKYVYYDCETMRGLLFSVVHFYVMNGYKLLRCKHCEKYFATKDRHNLYCDRISPCYNLVAAGSAVLRSPLNCEQAVRTIRQKFRDRKKSIYNNWCINSPERIDDLLNQCDYYFRQYHNAPVRENIISFQEYLYSDDMPKQERPNRRKSNAFKRELLGT